MATSLGDRTQELASRIDSSAALQTADQTGELGNQQERLEKLALAAIAKKLDSSAGSYQAAMESLNTAISAIGEAEKSIQQFSKAVVLVSKAADLVEAALKAGA